MTAPQEMIDKVVADRNYFSTQVSAITRYTNLGLIGVCWALLTSQKGVAELQSVVCWGITSRDILVFMLIPLVVALLIDFVQYVFGYLNTGVAYKRVVAPEASDDTIPYDETDTWYVAQQTCFKIKSWVTIANTVGVLIGLFSIL